MRSRTFACLVLSCLVASSAFAAARVELEVAGDAQAGAAMGFQQWLQALSRAGIQNVRMRAAQENVKVGIDVRGTDQNPLYVVTGIINNRDELVVPGARFTRGQAGRLKEWLDDLAKNGPPERREAKSAFGLSEKQFEAVRADLAKTVTFNTKGMTRSTAVDKIAKQLGRPLKIEGELAGGDEEIEDELNGLSSGTALACILRPAGYAMAPQESGGSLSYSAFQVSKEKLDREVWPIGWPPEKKAADVLPGLFEFRNVNVQNFSAAKVLEAVGKHIQVPILIDHNALARHGIDPDKVMVSHPQKRTNYSIALRKILFQAGLKFEPRVDEAGKGFLWVTSVKPV